MFFVIPTNHVEKGDIILVNGLPKCVREVKDNGDLECECGYCVNGECKLKNKDGFLPCNWEIAQ